MDDKISGSSHIITGSFLVRSNTPGSCSNCCCICISCCFCRSCDICDSERFSFLGRPFLGTFISTDGGCGTNALTIDTLSSTKSIICLNSLTIQLLTIIGGTNGVNLTIGIASIIFGMMSTGRGFFRFLPFFLGSGVDSVDNFKMSIDELCSSFIVTSGDELISIGDVSTNSDCNF